MILEPTVSQQVHPAHPLLWAVKTYLDLITKEEPLHYGSGLKRLYAMTCGIATLNDEDVEGITQKALGMNLIPHSLRTFMMKSITTNCKLYGDVLSALIQDRILGIANGDVVNPAPLLNYSPVNARRYFYTPPNTLLIQIDKALRDANYYDAAHTVMSSVATDAMLVLNRMTKSEGNITPDSTSYGLLGKVLVGLTDLLERETYETIDTYEYRKNARPALTILWVLAKMLMGDLTLMPLAQDINAVDLQHRLRFTDGTLASLPYPTVGTVMVFQDEEVYDMSMKGQMYLSAISVASFDRRAVD